MNTMNTNTNTNEESKMESSNEDTYANEESKVESFDEDVATFTLVSLEGNSIEFNKDYLVDASTFIKNSIDDDSDTTELNVKVHYRSLQILKEYLDLTGGHPKLFNIEPLKSSLMDELKDADGERLIDDSLIKFMDELWGKDYEYQWRHRDDDEEVKVGKGEEIINIDVKDNEGDVKEVIPIVVDKEDINRKRDFQTLIHDMNYLDSQSLLVLASIKLSSLLYQKPLHIVNIIMCCFKVLK